MPLCASLNSKKEISSSPQYGDSFLQVLDDQYVLNSDETLVDLLTAQKMELPRLQGGRMDLFPTPDGRFIVNSSEQFLEKNDFIEKLNKKSEKVKGKYQAPDPVTYESVGFLNQDAKSVTYRLINISNMKDITYDLEDKKFSSGPVFSLCPNLVTNSNIKVELPMVSKDGKYIGFNSNGLTIAKINDDGTCNVVKKLNMKSSKVSFSPDSRFVSFSSNILLTGKANKDSNLRTDVQVFVLDLQTNKILPITDSRYGTVKYASFSSAGDLVFNSYLYELGVGSKIVVIDGNEIQNKFESKKIKCISTGSELKKINQMTQQICNTSIQGLPKLNLKSLGKSFKDCQNNLQDSNLSNSGNININKICDNFFVQN